MNEGEIEEYIDDLVDMWHEGEDNWKEYRSLSEFLGMTPDQYKLWVETPSKFYTSGIGQMYIKDILGK